MNKEFRHFIVSESFEIMLGPKRLIDGKTVAKEFFRGPASRFKDRIGCYIFSLRTGRGCMPYYVGKTKRCFVDEAYAPHKISNHYQPILLRHKGTPIMQFVVLKEQPGRSPSSVINDLERYLIQVAFAKNMNLSNKQGIPKTRWTIDGVLNAKPGKPKKEVLEFKATLGL